MSQDSLIEKIKQEKKIEDIDFSKFEPQEMLAALKLKPEIIAARMQKILETQILSKYKLSVMSLTIMFIIMCLKEASQSDILEYTNSTPANLSQRIDWLIKNGYVDVELSREDKRRKILTLTEQGWSSTKAAMKESEKFKKEYAKHFTPQELEAYMRFNEKLSRVLDIMEKDLVDSSK